MPFDAFVGQVEASADGNPLKGLAGKVLFDIFRMSAQVDVWGGDAFLFRTSFVGDFLFISRFCDDDVVLTVELVLSGWVFLVDEVLFLEFKLELILLVRLDRDKSNTY